MLRFPEPLRRPWASEGLPAAAAAATGTVSRSSLEVASNPSGGIFLRAQSYPRSRSLLLLPRSSVRSSSNPTSQLERLPGSRAISCLMVPLSCLDPLSMLSALPIFLCIDALVLTSMRHVSHLLGLPAGRRGGRGWSPDGEGPWPCATAADGPHFGVVRPRTAAGASTEQVSSPSPTQRRPTSSSPCSRRFIVAG